MSLHLSKCHIVGNHMSRLIYRKVKSEIFLGLFWDRIAALSQSKNEQKLPKIVNNITNALALQFGENFMIIGPKNSKL